MMSMLCNCCVRELLILARTWFTFGLPSKTGCDKSPVPSSHAAIRRAVATTQRVRDESDHRAPRVSVVGDRVPQQGATDEGVPPVSEPRCVVSQRARVRG
jgi:hypothetical protein